MDATNQYCATLEGTVISFEGPEARFSGIPISVHDLGVMAESLFNLDIFPPSTGKVVESINESHSLTVVNSTQVYTLRRGAKQLLSEFAGEIFNLSIEDDRVVLTHPRWSLVGIGRSLAEAEADLVNEARDAFEGLSLFSLSEFSSEELDFRDFLLTVI